MVHFLKHPVNTLHFTSVYEPTYLGEIFRLVTTVWVFRALEDPTPSAERRAASLLRLELRVVALTKRDLLTIEKEEGAETLCCYCYVRKQEEES